MKESSTRSCSNNRGFNSNFGINNHVVHSRRIYLLIFKTRRKYEMLKYARVALAGFVFVTKFLKNLNEYVEISQFKIARYNQVELENKLI